MKLNKPDYLIIALFFITSFVLRLIHLKEFIFDYDEGVHLYSSKLITEGYVPYQDFFFGNPPLMVYFDAFLSELGLIFFGVRVIHIILSLAPLFFIYYIAKDLSHNKVVPTASLFLFSINELFFKNSKAVMLDPIISSLITLSFFIFLYQKTNLNLMIIGAILAISSLIKLTSLIALCAFIILVICSKLRTSVKFIKLFYLIFGFVIVFLPSILFFLNIEHSMQDIFMYQLSRSYISLSDRLQISNIPWHTSFFDIIVILSAILSFHLAYENRKLRELYLFVIIIVLSEFFLLR